MPRCAAAVHHPRAIESILAIIGIEFNLFQLFLFRHIQGFRNLRISQSMVVEELRIQAVAVDKPLHPLLE